MPSREEIVEALGQLELDAFEEVIRAAYQQRHDLACPEPSRPDVHAAPEDFARWLAQRHMSSDAAIERVVYLPTNSPPNEIRLLEVNRFLNPSDGDAVEPLDFTPDIEGIPFKVFVADITADQWERIQRGSGANLPGGWRLEDRQTFVRA